MTVRRLLLLATVAGLLAGTSMVRADDRQRADRWGPVVPGAVTTTSRDSMLRIPAALRLGPDGITPRGPGSPPTPLDATWRFSPPPRGAVYAAAIDRVRDRLVALAPDGTVWALPLDASQRAWARVEATGRAPDALQYSVAEPATNRILCVGTHPTVSAAVTAFALELSDPPNWTVLDNARGDFPGPRRDFSVAYDTMRRRLFLFGGSYRELLDDVWTFDLGTRRWTKHTPSGTGPAPRVGASTVYDPLLDRYILHGGAVEAEPRILSATDEVWCLSGDGGHWERQAVGDSAMGPGRRLGHHGLFDRDNACALYFVSPRDSTERGAVYCLEGGASLSWRRLDPGGAQARLRSGARAAYDAERDHYVLAGGTAGPDLVDVDVLSLRPTPAWSAWRGLPAAPGRFGHTLVLDPIDDRMILFGGIGDARAYHNDVWTAALERPFEWQSMTVTGAGPAPRSEAVSVYDPLRRRMVVHGGWRHPNDYMNDTWLLDLISGEWTQAPTWGDLPPGRRSPAGILDPARDRLVLFGGYDGAYRGDVWTLSLPDMRWEQILADGAGPGGRLFSSATHDPLRDRMLVYGGSDQSRSSGELWSLDLERPGWSQLSSSTYMGLSRHTAVYDPVDDRLIVHGGFDIHWDLIITNSWTFSFDLRESTSFAWMLTNAAGMSGHASVFDARRDRVVSTGGFDFPFGPLSGAALLELGRTALSAWILYVLHEPEGLRMAWQIAGGAGTLATFERRGVGGDWVPLVSRVADQVGRVEFTDTQLRPGWRYDYRVRIGGVASSPSTIDIDGDPPLRLFGAWPNPARGSDVTLEMALVAGHPVRLELFDVQGRCALSTTFFPASSGVQRHHLGERLRPGIYLARIAQREASATRKIVVLSAP